jgi:Domain of unknown function (DUF4338)
MDLRQVPPTFISGRHFTAQEIQDIQETVREFSCLSWTELVETICEHLVWVTPRGENKFESCAKALEKLEHLGLLKLPAKRLHRRQRQQIQVGIRTQAQAEVSDPLADLEPIGLEPATGREAIRYWNEYVERYHPLGYKQPFGAHQRYFIVSGSETQLGCMLFAASAWALAERDAWIGWSKTDRAQRLNWVLNQTRFLLFPWVRVKNLASKVLSLAAQRIRQDWQERYGYQPVLLETFVDAGHYLGTCYQAANWIRLGLTRGSGCGRMNRHSGYLSTPKVIYVYPLVADFRAFLFGEAR